MKQTTAFTDSFGKYRFIYKITYPITGQFYIGKHTTANLNDKYMGSGTSIKELYKQIGGSEKCIKEILIFTDTLQELNQLERLYIKDAKTNKLCINRASGGDGGWEYVNSDKVWTSDKRSKSQIKRFQDPEQRKLTGEKSRIGMQNMSKENFNKMCINISKAQKKFRAEHPNFQLGFCKGSHHTPETKAKISASNTGKKPSNIGMTARIDKETGRKTYFNVNDNIPSNYITQKQYNRLVGKENKAQIAKQKRHDQFIAKKLAYIQETQEMADYFVKYGYEATCKKFPGRSGTCSKEAMLMRFIKARKNYGIRFESMRTAGKSRKFDIPPAIN